MSQLGGYQEKGGKGLNGWVGSAITVTEKFTKKVWGNRESKQEISGDQHQGEDSRLRRK